MKKFIKLITLVKLLLTLDVYILFLGKCLYMFLIGQTTVFHDLGTVCDLGFAAGFKCS